MLGRPASNSFIKNNPIGYVGFIASSNHILNIRRVYAIDFRWTPASCAS